ncbi:hypothetical protein MGA447_2682 [Enterococcus faecalis]|nr:hypothetical protein MGA447_2682 [Enterococcus faecalis]
MTNIDHYYIELCLLNKEERFDFNKKCKTGGATSVKLT